MKKLIGLLTICTALVIQAIQPVYAVGFDGDIAKSTWDSFAVPLTNFIMVAIPIAVVIAAGIAYLVWLGKSEEEKENRPFFKSVKNYIGGALVVWLIPVLLRIFGIS